MKKTSQAGFTLVEVLIAMFIFSLISVGATSALTSSLRGKAQMNERLSAMHKIESARAIMRADLSQITLRESRDAYGSTLPYALSGGIEDLITFTRRGRLNPGGLENRSEFQRVTYVCENGDLIRRSLDQVNPAPQTQFRDRVLLSSLGNCDMTFHIKANRQAVIGGVSVDVSLNHFPQDTLLVAPHQETELPTFVTLDLGFKNGNELRQHFEINL